MVKSIEYMLRQKGAGLDISPIDYFNQWSTIPIRSACSSVLATIDGLNAHPLATDITAQDYVMPSKRYFESPGRFRIYGENQDVFYCFVLQAEADASNPPVYFESCLDLITDYGIDPDSIIDNDHALITPTFERFLWHILGHQLCLRMERASYMIPSVCGSLFEKTEHCFSKHFTGMLGTNFFAGYTALFALDTVVIPDWGAVFLDPSARTRFVSAYKPSVTREWA